MAFYDYEGNCWITPENILDGTFSVMISKIYLIEKIIQKIENNDFNFSINEKMNIYKKWNECLLVRSENNSASIHRMHEEYRVSYSKFLLHVIDEKCRTNIDILELMRSINFKIRTIELELNQNRIDLENTIIALSETE